MRRNSTGRNFLTAVVMIGLPLVTLIVLQKYTIIDLGSGNARVLDGDSLRLNRTEIRLYGIDAPEYQQHCADAAGKDYACGQIAADALRELVQGKDVACKAIDQDRYGRAVSICKVGELEINKTMVSQGWAVAFSQFGLDYVRVEQDAHKARRGLWAGSFEEPSAYRHRMQNAGNGLISADTPEPD